MNIIVMCNLLGIGSNLEGGLTFLLTRSSGFSIERLESVHFGALPREFRFRPAFSQTATARALFYPGDDVAKES